MATGMGKRAVLIPVVLLILAGLLGWRVRVQDQRRHAPTGGSATIEGTDTVVASKIAGRLLELSVDEGDRVKAGQVVGRLECSDQEAALAAARARLSGADAQREVAEAAAQQARRNTAVADSQVHGAQAQERVLAVDRERASRDLGRASRLRAEGATSEVDLDNSSTRSRGLAEQERVVSAGVRTALAATAAAQAGVRTATAQIAAARSALEAARADVKRAELAVTECRLVAPRDGVVTERLHEPGAVLPAAARILSIVDLSTVKVSFFVPDAELGRVKLGAPAEVRVDAYPDRVFAGKVHRIASEAEFTPRDVQTREDRDRLVYAVEIEVENRDGALRAGMPGDVVLPGTAR
jgi:HlyD family secretion protein